MGRGIFIQFLYDATIKHGWFHFKGILVVLVLCVYTNHKNSINNLVFVMNIISEILHK